MNPLDRAGMLRGSIHCFVLGLLSLVPVIGLPAGLFGLLHFFRIRMAAAEEWNAAGPYLNWGLVLSGIGLLLSLITIAVVALAVVASWN